MWWERIEPASASLHSEVSCMRRSGSARMQITIIPPWVWTVKHRYGLLKPTSEGERICINTRAVTLQAGQPWLKRSFLLCAVKTNMLTTVSLHCASGGHPGQQWDLMTFRLHASAAQCGPLALPRQHHKHFKTRQIFSIHFKTLYTANANKNKLWKDFKCTDAI